jgi:hypothetical protein
MAKRRKQTGAPWGNRVVRVGTAKAGELQANERNWRIHPRAQQDAMSATLGEIGFIQGVIVNLRSHEAWGKDRGVETVIDGHMRVELALSRGEDQELPVTYVDLTPVEEQRALMTYDPIGALAGTDDEKLTALLNDNVVDWPESTLDVDALFKRSKKQVSFEADTDRHNVIVECAGEQEQVALMERLREEGLTCRPTTRKA